MFFYESVLEEYLFDVFNFYTMKENYRYHFGALQWARTIYSGSEREIYSQIIFRIF